MIHSQLPILYQRPDVRSQRPDVSNSSQIHRPVLKEIFRFCGEQ